MSLPKIEHPLFPAYLSSIDTEVKFRPFLTREEKILLIARESGNSKNIISAIKQIITNCVMSPESFDVNKLAMFDLEGLFIQLRARSINNIVKVKRRDPDDGRVYDLEVDLDKVVVKTGENHSKTIKVDDKIGFTLKYPVASITDELTEAGSETERLFDVIYNIIDVIYDENQSYPANAVSKQELATWIDSLPTTAFDQIQHFFMTMPKIFVEVPYTNSLGEEKKVRFTTLTDFFIFV